MEPDQWQRITDVFDAAITRTPNERIAFLEEVCHGDKGLRDQVERMVKSHDHSGDFLESPAFAVAPEFLTTDGVGAQVGERIGHYRIESLLGIGGMGEVYLARDERLERKVALKLLPERLTADDAQLSRFKHEARTASALNHPNILTVHEIGVDGSRHFIATEFIEGETLRATIAQGQLNLREVLDIAVQVGSALAAAHKSGILHRDIKPENIMLRPDAYVKVLDFGIAKLAEQEEAGRDGLVMGTVRYMSPEQARGETVDARSDIWSLGVVLYEMLGGNLPLEDETPRLKVSARLKRIVQKALRRNREERYQSADEMLGDLRHFKEAESKRKLIAPLTTAAAVVVVGITAFFYLRPSQGLTNNSKRPAPAIPEKSIAVLPFKNLSDDQQNAYFADGVQDEILTALAKIADLRVISRTSVMQYKDMAKPNLPEIAQALKVAHVLEGSVQRSGNRVRVTAKLVDARTDAHRWAERYDRDLADVFAIQSEIAESIAHQLHAALSPNEQAAMRAKPTEDMAAYDLYLRAKEIGRMNSANLPEEVQEQVTLLRQAVARDPAFVPALCLLARVHLIFYWFNHDRSAGRLALAKEAVEAAARLQPDAGEVHLARAILYYHGSRDYAPALAELALARRSLPNDPDVAFFSGLIERRRGRWAESTRHLEEAIAIDPQNKVMLSDLGNNYAGLKLYQKMARLYDDALVSNLGDFECESGRAEVDFIARADLRRMQKVIEGEATRKADPERVVIARLQLALLQRDFPAAEQALAAYGLADLDDRSFTTPREWFEGVIAQGLGARAKAQTAFLAARERAAATVTQRPALTADESVDAKGLIVLAEIDARLGRKEEAIAEAQRAVELLPAAKDAADSPAMLSRLASIYAQAGETSRALELLGELAKMPWGPSYGSLKLDETWDPLRREPRFRKLLAESQRKAGY